MGSGEGDVHLVNLNNLTLIAWSYARDTSFKCMPYQWAKVSDLSTFIIMGNGKSEFEWGHEEQVTRPWKEAGNQITFSEHFQLQDNSTQLRTYIICFQGGFYKLCEGTIVAQW